MPKLYVANTTVQYRDFVALIPETTNMLRQKLRPGHQGLVYDGPMYIIENIIKQNEVYGLCKETDLANAKGFVGMVYNIDRPVSKDTLGLADGQNHRALIELGVEVRENVANYAQASIQNTMREAGEEGKSMQIEIKDLAKDATFHEIFAPEKPKELQSAKPRARRKKD